MARTRNLIANYVSFDMQKTAMRINGMSDEELGKWFRKALIDLLSGCIDPNTDPFVKEQYDRSHAHMVQQQNHNSRIYQNRLARTNGQENHADESINEPIPEQKENASPEDGNILELTPKAVKKPYGQNKFVMLTDEEGSKLRIAYKEDLELAISILDGYLENNPKARKKYKSHYSVLRRGGWVWNKVLEVKNNEQRLENATKRNGNQSFKQMEIDKRTEFFTTSIADRMMNNG